MSYTKDMRRDRIKKTITYLSLLFWLCLLVACGQQEETTDDGVTYFHHSIADRNTQETQENSTETEKSEEFLLTAVDQIQESLQLYRYADGMEYRYYYGTGTRFYDKYGNRTPVTSFEPGLLVTIGDVDSEGILTEARVRRHSLGGRGNPSGQTDSPLSCGPPPSMAGARTDCKERVQIRGLPPGQVLPFPSCEAGGSVQYE